MADIKLKDISGTEVTYIGVEKVQLQKADGSGLVEFGTKADFLEYYGTYTSAVENFVEYITINVKNLMVSRAHDMTLLGLEYVYDKAFLYTNLLITDKNNDVKNMFMFRWGRSGYYAGAMEYEKEGDMLFSECDPRINVVNSPKYETTTPPNLEYENIRFNIFKYYGGGSADVYNVYLIKNEKLKDFLSTL